MDNSSDSQRRDRRDFLLKGTLVGVGAVALAGCPVDDDDDSAGEECPDYPRAFPDQDTSEVRWGFLIDVKKCRGCSACSVACKTENDVRLGVFRNSVIEGETGEFPDTRRVQIPWLCNHCENPVCLDRCPAPAIRASLEMPSGEVVEYWARATYQRPDGLVLVDQTRCVGCGRCVEECPYGTRFPDWGKAAQGDASAVGLEIADPRSTDKCTLCVHRLEKGLTPACIETCPADARVVGNLNDPSSEINQLIEAAGDRVSVANEGAGTIPRVYYIDFDDEVFDNGRDIRLESGRQYDVPGV